MSTTSSCPNENELLDLLSGRATEASAKVLGAHVGSCIECQDLVGELSRGDTPEVLRRGDAVGRYLVLGVLGAGAMGVVYEAYDPELERSVALKLVKTPGSGPRGDELRARLLREGQAMARLHHPNVITVFDVGRFGEQVFVTMELVRGGTLRAWLATPRTPGEILARFLEAGRGLEAAHAAGLVHRDFKPDNVLVGLDGRARVTDFGLARLGASASSSETPAPEENMTRTGAAIGTPAYMAPEQLRGEPSDARADVFSFCVALCEALSGERPWAADSVAALRTAVESEPHLPSAHRAVLRRGLALSPEARWQSMGELLAALDNTPRRRRLAVGSALTLGIAALAFLSYRAAGDPCAEAANAWGTTWNEPARAAVKQAYAATGTPWANAAFESLAKELDARQLAWTTMRREACEATRVHATQSAALLERRNACLDSRRAETAALVRLLGEADSDTVERGAGPAKSLTPLDDCANPRALGEAPPLTGEAAVLSKQASDETAQARALLNAGKYTAGRESAGRAVALAQQSGDLRAEGEASFVEGRGFEEEMKYPDAERAYHHAVERALRAKDDRVLADAWMRLAGIAGYRREVLSEAWLWLSYAEQAIINIGDDKHRRGRMYERRSLLEWSLEGKLEEAELDLARSKALLAGLSEAEAPRFQPVSGPAAFDMGRFDVALQVFEKDIAQIKTEKGPEHPELLEAEENAAEVLAIMGRCDEAVSMLRGLIARFPDRAEGYTTHRLAEALRRQGNVTEALVWDERALASPESPDPDSTMLAQPLVGRGLDLLLLGRAKEALVPLERAAVLRTRMHQLGPAAELHFALARALWESGGDRTRAAALAEQAEGEYREAVKRWGSRWFAAEAETIAQWRKGHST